MRAHVARYLHRLGIHIACRRRWERFGEPYGYRLNDGSIWRPALNGMPGPEREVHG